MIPAIWRVFGIAVAVPSFDCWIEGEWVREELFGSREEAIKAFRSLIVTYLSPEAIARYAEALGHRC